MKKIIIQTIQHRGKTVFMLNFEKDTELISLCKQIGAKFSKTCKGWWIEEGVENLKIIHKTFEKYSLNKEENQQLKSKKVQLTAYDQLTDSHKKSIERYKQYLKSKRFAESTIRTYIHSIQLFLAFFKDRAMDTLTNEDVIVFNNEYILVRKLSSSFQNQMVNSIKKFFLVIENRKMDIDAVHRPKREQKLPNVLSKEEIKRIIEAPKNLKHRSMLSVIYACGLRRSELLNLKPNHIDSKRKLLIIYQSKGKKDRVIPIGDKIIDLLREYYKAYRPKEWLFEGQIKGNKYSATSLEKVLKQSLQRAKIKKPVTLHWLRHSFATHLMESGTDMRYVQVLLGHKSSRTTEIYTHVSTKSLQNIKSPFDDL